MASQNVIFWNSAGFRASTYSTPDKFYFLDKQYPNGNFAIAALVESHHKDDLDYSQDLGNTTKPIILSTRRFKMKPIQE